MLYAFCAFSQAPDSQGKSTKITSPIAQTLHHGMTISSFFEKFKMF